MHTLDSLGRSAMLMENSSTSFQIAQVVKSIEEVSCSPSMQSASEPM